MLDESQVTSLKLIVAGSQELTALATSGDDVAFAVALSAAVPSIPKPRSYILDLSVYSILGLAAGEAFLSTIAALAAGDSQLAPAFVRVDRRLKADTDFGLDVGDKLLQQTLMSQTVSNGGPLADDSVAKIIAYGSQPQTFTIEEVAQLR